MQPAERLKWFKPGKAMATGLFLLALLIRLPGLGWGLKNDLHNASYHPDEPVIFGASRAIVPGQGQFLPGFYNYGTLYLTMLRVASDITTTYTGGPKPGYGWSPTDPDRTDWDWVSRCHLAGRFISALAGAGTALLAFFIGRRSFGFAAGGIAGLVMAIAPAFVMHSRFQTVDVVAMFFLTCSMFQAVKIATGGNGGTWLRAALWCGLFAGLSAGTKYTGGLALFSLYAALGLVSKGQTTAALKAAAAGTGAAVAAFFLTTPGALLQTTSFLRDLAYEREHMASGHDIVFTGTPSAFLYHLINLGIGIDALLAVLGVAGLLWAAYRRHGWALVLLAFWVPYYLVISRAEVKFIRYSIPLELAVAVGCGYAMVAAHRRGGWGRIAVGLGILGFGGVGGGGLASTLITTRKMMGIDPRDETSAYLRTQGGRVGIPRDTWFWSPPLFPNSAEPRSVPAPLRLQQMQTEANPPIDFVVNDDGGFTEWDPRLVTAQKPDHITFSSFEYLPVERLRSFKDLPGDQQGLINTANLFVDDLQSTYEPDKAFGSPVSSWLPEELMPEDFLYAQPIVWVWKRK